MKMLTSTLIACALLGGCATESAPRPAGSYPRAGDGTTRETAVRLRTMDEREAERMMARWLRKNYPDYKVLDQMIVDEHGTTYSVVQIAGPNSTTKRIYFDISMYSRRSNDPNPNPLPLPPRP